MLTLTPLFYPILTVYFRDSAVVNLMPADPPQSRMVPRHPGVTLVPERCIGNHHLHPMVRETSNKTDQDAQQGESGDDHDNDAFSFEVDLSHDDECIPSCELVFKLSNPGQFTCSATTLASNPGANFMSRCPNPS